MAKAPEHVSEKDAIIEMIRRLPDDCTLEDTQYHLYVRQRIAEGLRSIEEEEGIPQEEVEDIVRSWHNPNESRR